MKLQRLEDGQLYLVGDKAPSRVRHAISGPFANKFAAYWWIIDKSESSMTADQRQLWERCLRLAGKSAPVEHLLGIVGLIRRNCAESLILKSSQPLYQ